MSLPSFAEILPSKTLPALNGFRMLAVLSVVLAHAGVGFILTARHGVAGFFVLSGFLITWLLLREFEKNQTISFKNFYMRRALRIFPAYYAFVTVSVAWDLYRGNDNIREMILPSLFYLVNYHNALQGHSSASVAHLWSLAVEEQFYFLWPLVFLTLVGRSKVTVIRFLVGAILAVMIWRSVAFSVLEFGDSYAYNAFDTRFDNLAIGCLLALLMEKPGFRAVMDRLSSKFWMPLLTLVLLTLSRLMPSPDYEYGPAFTIDALLLAMLLVQLIRLSHGRFWGWLNHPVSVYLGIISYPIYLWHVWGLQAGHKLGFLPETGQLLMGIGFSVLLATGSYYCIEKPFLRLKGRYQPRLTGKTRSGENPHETQATVGSKDTLS